jgi:hypothetical protein
MNDNCSIFFSNIYEYFEKYTRLEDLDITYNQIIDCTNDYGDNIIVLIFRNISTYDTTKVDYKVIPLLNKVISIVKSNTSANNYDRVLKEIFNKPDYNKNNWLQLLIQTLDYRYNNTTNHKQIKFILYSLTDILNTYIPYTNIDNKNNYGDIALLNASHNKYFNNITLDHLATEKNINHLNDSGDSAILICSYNHTNLELLDKLLDNFSNINVNIINKYENNVLFNLITYEKENDSDKKLILSIVNKLIDRGINLKYSTSSGGNALVYSIIYNKPDIFKAIFDKLISSDKQYIINSTQTFINSSSTNITKYYNEHISLKDRYSSNFIPLMTPSNDKIPSSDISIKYGVELEICVKLDKKCIKRDVNTGSIIYTHRDNNSEHNINTSDPKEWYDLTSIYLDNYIKQRSKTNEKFKHLVNKMKDKYKFFVVTNTPKNKKYKYIYDLDKLQLIKKDGIIDYTNPIITTDISVKCGDYKYLYNERRIPSINTIRERFNITKDNDIENTFHIEFVTPILTCNPIIGKNGISYDLSPLNDLFLLIGMDKQGCYVTNKSQGFHVNLSLVNNKTGKGLPLLREFFKTQFFKNYIEWEKEAYPKYRKEESEYAMPLYSIINPDNNSGFAKIASNKYVSLHRKDIPELVEVRLFAATNDYKGLVTRTKEALALLYSSYNNWYSNIKSVVYNVNKKKNTTKKKQKNYINLSSKPNINIRNNKRFKTKNKRKISY